MTFPRICRPPQIPTIGISEDFSIILSARPLSRSANMSSVELRVPGIKIASTSPMSSFTPIILSATSLSYSNGSISVKLAIFGRRITPMVMSLSSSNTWVVSEAESSSGNFKVSSYGNTPKTGSPVISSILSRPGFRISKLPLNLLMTVAFNRDRS